MPHQFHPSILRAYDIRGVVGSTLFPEDAYWVGKSFGYVARTKGAKSVCVGRDGRLSSLELSEQLIQGLREAGLDVINIGLGSSPLLYFAEYFLETDGSLVVTGSHNPTEYNGIKLTLFKEPFFGDDIQGLAAIAMSQNLQDGQGAIQDVDLKAQYIDRLLAGFPRDSSLKVIWDPGHGAAAELTSLLVQKLPGEHGVINGDIDGTFPSHHPDPTVAENLVQLQAEVIEKRADLGIAFDGDGDRLGMVDGHGRILWGDQILMILARDVLKRHQGATIIADVKASQTLFDEVKSHGGVPLMWKTGHSHIRSKMAEEGALLAGEMSGHIFCADDYYGFDDGLYAAVRFLGVLLQSGQSLEEIYDHLPDLPSTPEIRIDCSPERKFEIPVDVKKRLEAEELNFSAIDGVRVNLPQGWWLLRTSNTQDVLVVRCEAQDSEGLSTTIDHLMDQLRLSGLSEQQLQMLEDYKPNQKKAAQLRA